MTVIVSEIVVLLLCTATTYLIIIISPHSGCMTHTKYLWMSNCMTLSTSISLLLSTWLRAEIYLLKTWVIRWWKRDCIQNLSQKTHTAHVTGALLCCCVMRLYSCWHYSYPRYLFSGQNFFFWGARQPTETSLLLCAKLLCWRGALSCVSTNWEKIHLFFKCDNKVSSIINT